jgi:hypothetical protein
VEVKELVLSRQELQVLCNYIHSGEKRYIHVSFPFFDLELFTLDIQKPELTKIVRAKRFEEELYRRRPADRSVNRDEFPNFTDLRNCLLSSGFLNYTNEDEVARNLLELKDDTRDPNKRPRPFFVAVDTNVLYDKFLSRHLPLKEGITGRLVDAADFRYVVTEIVQLEIDSKITHKYSREEIGALGKLCAHREFLNEFRNGSGKRARLAKLAQNEMSYLMTQLRALRIKGTPAEDKEENDRRIAESYRNWSRSGDYEVLLLTADEDMVHHAISNELMTLQLEIPFEVPEHGRIDPWAVSDLLYDLTGTFGAISLDNEGIVLLGEWGGKSSTDSASEHVKAVFEDESKQGRIAQQLSICRRILARYPE